MRSQGCQIKGKTCWTVLLVQPSMQLSFAGQQTADSCSALPTRTSKLFSAELLPSQSVLASAIVWAFSVPDAGLCICLCQTSWSFCFQPVKVALNSSSAVQHINHSSQLGIICALAEKALFVTSRSLNSIDLWVLKILFPLAFLKMGVTFPFFHS